MTDNILEEVQSSLKKMEGIQVLRWSLYIHKCRFKKKKRMEWGSGLELIYSHPNIVCINYAIEINLINQLIYLIELRALLQLNVKYGTSNEI